jgi:hypothetical protein
MDGASQQREEALSTSQTLAVNFPTKVGCGGNAWSGYLQFCNGYIATPFNAARVGYVFHYGRRGRSVRRRRVAEHGAHRGRSSPWELDGGRVGAEHARIYGFGQSGRRQSYARDCVHE